MGVGPFHARDLEPGEQRQRHGEKKYKQGLRNKGKNRIRGGSNIGIMVYKINSQDKILICAKSGSKLSKGRP